MLLCVYTWVACRGGVTQQLLYLAHVGSVVEQMGGEGVPQHMRAAFPQYALRMQFALHDAVDPGPGDTIPFRC